MLCEVKVVGVPTRNGGVEDHSLGRDRNPAAFGVIIQQQLRTLY